MEHWMFSGDTSIVIEGLYLDQFTQLGTVNRYGEAVRHNQPPTLDRIDQETSLGENEMGTGLRRASIYGRRIHYLCKWHV